MRLKIVAGCFAVLIAFSSIAHAAPKPNVLFIAVDDLRPQLGCYGESQMHTPNIDGLAKQGLQFNRAYCQQAVCSPSRTSLLTGRRPDTTKIYDLETHFRSTIPDVVTLPQYFMQNGYHSQGFGKIYHGSLNDPKSWSVPHYFQSKSQYFDPKILEALKKRGADTSEVGGKTKGPPWEIADCGDSDLPDGDIADHAITAMNAVKDKPFFLAVGFIKPHLPFVAPKKYYDLYPRESIKLPPNSKPPKDVPKVAITNFGELRAYVGMPKTEPLTEDQAIDMIRGNYAATSYMDAQVGRVLAELDKLNLRDNTIIILWGDHGWHLLEQGLWCKHTCFENSARAAMMISVPGQTKRGTKTDALVEYVDIYPTLCELAGLSLPEGLEGTSFAPLIKDPTRAWKSAAFSQYPREGEKVMGYSMRTDRYRYTEWQERATAKVRATELYDHQSDPAETVNVAGKPENAETVKELSKQLKAGWRAAIPKS